MFEDKNILRRKQKEILDRIYYDLGNQHTDLEVFSLKKKDDEVISSKHLKFSEAVFPVEFDGSCEDWRKQKFFSEINNRTICKNEVVLDIETKEKTKEIKNKLKEIDDCDIFMYDSGSVGIHVHLWYRNPIKKEIKEKLIEIFGADSLKSGEKSPIQLEDTLHWKRTGRKKKLIWKQISL